MAQRRAESLNGGNQRRSAADPDAVQLAVEMLLAASRPVLFIGHGVALSEAEAELSALAHRLDIPVISSPNGMGCLDMTDPLSLGFGLQPNRAAARRGKAAPYHRTRFIGLRLLGEAPR